MKKIHRYEMMFYTEGNYLERKLIEASTKAEAIEKAHEQFKIIEIHRVRFID